MARAAYVSCLLLLLAATSGMPLYAADDSATTATTEQSPVSAASIPDAATAPAGDDGSETPELNPGDRVPVISSAPDQVEKTGDIMRPREALIIGQGRPMEVKRPDLTSTPARLAAAGILLIPLDRTLANIVPRISSGSKADGLTEAVNKLGTPGVLLPALGGMYLLGDDYDKDTARMALAALVNAGIITEGAKLLTGRGRPSELGDAGEFEGPRSGKGFSSFPSGHTAAAFTVATVLANRHPKQKWLYYGLAAAVGFARVRKSAHFPSDVLVGAGIGIYAGNNAIHNGPRIFSIKL